MRFKHILPATFFVLCFAPLAWGQKLDLEQVERSVGYINNLQNPDGGFRVGESDRVSDLGATTTSLRALRYLHPQARPRDKEGAAEFVLKCYDKSTGSFALSAGGKADVRSTAMGLMSMVELKMPTKDYAAAINQYFTENAKSLGDIYIATAALQSAEIPAIKAVEWIATFEATRNADGRYGKDPLDTAGAVNTILRLGGTLKDRAAALKVLRAAQRADGGFSKSEEPSELGSTYRMMRAFFMLHEKPDIERCREFVARCRNGDGGYGVSAAQPSTSAATYYAAIVLHWLDELSK